MERFIIDGAIPLQGEVTPAGNKNATLPMLAASLLTEEPIIYHNVPDILDVKAMRQLLLSLGVEIELINHHTLKVQARQVRPADLDPELTRKIRASILLAGPMTARSGEVRLPPPGGDVIGRRRVDTHLLALRKLGAAIDYDRYFTFKAGRLVGADILLDEASVTATENAIMAASTARGVTHLRNAASEPHIQELCHMINKMGGRIENIGSNTLTIHGVDRLHGAEVEIGPDYLEVVSFIGAAVVTHGSIKIRKAGHQYLDMIRMSIAIVVATQSKGTILFHDWMYPSRMFFIDKLVGMGAHIVLCDPHRCIIQGPSPLFGEKMESPDIRAGMALLLAALSANGRSVIRNVGQIDRGYEIVDQKLAALGAKISRETE